MDDENTYLVMDTELAPGEVISHTVLVLVTTRLDSFDEQVQVITSPHTSRVASLGALTEALEIQKQPAYEYVDEEDEDE